MLQLQTFLTETEAIINSRPLAYLGKSINQSINEFQGKIQTVEFTNIYKHFYFYMIYL